ncbi:MAG: hypothetical protein ACNA8K_16935 [Cyclonatronaceae bacterium]
MGKSKLLIPPFILIISVFLIIYFDVFFSMKSKIYFTNVHESFLVNRFYGLSDEKFDLYIAKFEVIGSDSAGYKLNAYNHEFYGTPPFLTVTVDSGRNEYLLLDQREGYKYIDYEQYLIDVDVFNVLLELIGVTSDIKIINTFLSYIHYAPNWDKSLSEVLQEIAIRKNSVSIYHYSVWHEPRGLVDYCFTIKENKLLKVNSVYLGLRGDEPYPLHDGRWFGKPSPERSAFVCE